MRRVSGKRRESEAFWRLWGGDRIREDQTRLFLNYVCLCLSDTRHFRRFRGSEEQSPCLQWVECKFAIFAVFLKTGRPLFGRRQVYQKTVCATPTEEAHKLCQNRHFAPLGPPEKVNVPRFLGKDWEFPNLVASNLVACNFYAESLFCSLSCGLAFALFCTHLRPFACFCSDRV